MMLHVNVRHQPSLTNMFAIISNTTVTVQLGGFLSLGCKVNPLHSLHGEERMPYQLKKQKYGRHSPTPGPAPKQARFLHASQLHAAQMVKAKTADCAECQGASYIRADRRLQDRSCNAVGHGCAGLRAAQVQLACPTKDVGAQKPATTTATQPRAKP